MATTDTESILRAVYEAFNARDLEKLRSYASAGARVTNVPFGETLGFVEDFEAWAQAFPDGKIEVKTIIAQGDHGMAEIVGRGTHTGTLKSPTGDLPATGRRAELELAEVYDLRNGKITAMRYYFDAFSFLQQLGVGAAKPKGEARGPEASPRH